MKSVFLKFLAVLVIAGSFTSCNFWTNYYVPSWHYNCYPVYSYWGYYLYDECYWEYYNQDGTTLERDMVSEVADKEALLLDKLTNVYAQKFSLSMESAAKVAKNVQDFSALSERSADDIADFAQKLYGVNPSEIVSALSSAQVGDNDELDALIEKAGQSLGTNKAQTRALVKELHGKALEANGIQL